MQIRQFLISFMSAFFLVACGSPAINSVGVAMGIDSMPSNKESSQKRLNRFVRRKFNYDTLPILVEKLKGCIPPNQSPVEIKYFTTAALRGNAFNITSLSVDLNADIKQECLDAIDLTRLHKDFDIYYEKGTPLPAINYSIEGFIGDKECDKFDPMDMNK